MKQYFSFQWHITDECDQRCKHCYIFSEDNCKKLDSMTWEQMKDTFYNCLDFCQTYDRLPYFYITGVEKIKCIKNAGIRAVIMTTVSGTNIDEIPDIIDTVVAHRADVFAFARYCPTSEEKDVGITPARYRKLLADCDRKFKEYEAAGCETYFNKKDHLWTLYEYETGEFQIPENAEEGVIYGGCNCGNCHMTILPTGEVFACRRVQNSRVGNVFKDRLADIWICQMEQYRDYTKFEKCAKCELLAWCRGCPAVASGKDGEFYAADPQCWKETA